MKEILDDDETILRTAKPAFIPFVLRTTPELIAVIGSGVLGYFWIRTFSGMDNFSFSADDNVLNGIPNIFLLGLVLPILKPLYKVLVFIFIYPNTLYSFSEKRITLRSGFFGIDYKTIDYDQITDIEVRVNPIEKLFSVGTISIYAGHNAEGERTAVDDIIAIRDPYGFFKELKKTKTDVKTDWEYPNALRPDENPGYKTKYKP